MADLKRVYAAPAEETALNELELFKHKWDSEYPKICKFWHDNWATLSTYFKYLEVVWRLIYTTNVIEGVNKTAAQINQKQDCISIHSQLEIYFEERLEKYSI